MRPSIFLLFSVILAGCLPAKKATVVKKLEALSNSFQHHSGFYLYDPDEKKVLIDHNGDRYFTPASNTKIFTLYASLKILGDSLPGLYYKESRDSLILWGTGDPALLYSYLPQGNLLEFLSRSEKELYFSGTNFYEKPLGPGWSWDDYNYTYSVERTPLPIYGNALSISKESQSPYLSTKQSFFKTRVSLGDSIPTETEIVREIGTNRMLYLPSKTETGFELEVPFRYDVEVITSLLSDTLQKKVKGVDIPLSGSYSTLFSIPTDSALKVMMQESDNFIAEQLLLTCAGMLSDSLQSNITIDHVKSTFLSQIPDQPQWVDGSGLSRYNLFTPRSIVWLWDRLLLDYNRERLFPLLATGGLNGTIKNYYKSEPPYIYGKTGTLSNNHCLSGYLLTKSGKTLIFSFMNNNYPTESRPVKREMERILWEVRERY